MNPVHWHRSTQIQEHLSSIIRFLWICLQTFARPFSSPPTGRSSFHAFHLETPSFLIDIGRLLHRPGGPYDHRLVSTTSSPSASLALPTHPTQPPVHLVFDMRRSCLYTANGLTAYTINTGGLLLVSAHTNTGTSSSSLISWILCPEAGSRRLDRSKAGGVRSALFWYCLDLATWPDDSGSVGEGLETISFMAGSSVVSAKKVKTSLCVQ